MNTTDRTPEFDQQSPSQEVLDLVDTFFTLAEKLYQMYRDDDGQKLEKAMSIPIIAEEQKPSWKRRIFGLFMVPDALDSWFPFPREDRLCWPITSGSIREPHTYFAAFVDAKTGQLYGSSLSGSYLATLKIAPLKEEMLHHLQPSDISGLIHMIGTNMHIMRHSIHQADNAS